jgi:tetratricopeptide (TPR) repeat protein
MALPGLRLAAAFVWLLTAAQAVPSAERLHPVAQSGPPTQQPPPGPAVRDPARASEPQASSQDPLAQQTAYFEFLRGRHLEGEGKLTEALDAYERASHYDPRSAPIRAEMAALYARQGRTEEALREAERALILDPSSADAHWLLGTIYATSLDARTEASTGPAATEGRERPGSQPAGDESTIDRAIHHLDAARPQRRYDIGLHVTLGRLYLARRDWGKAIEVLAPVLEREPEAVEAAFLLAQAYDGQDDRSRAIEVLERALSIEPDAVRPLLYLADLSARERQWDRAADAFGRASSANPGNLDLRLRYAAALVNAGRPQAARDVLRELGERQSNEPRVLSLQVDVERALREYDAAERTARRLVELQPSQPFGAQALAQVYADRREYAQVITTLEPAITRGEAAEGARTLVPLRLALGLAYQELRQFDKAIAAFEQARADGGGTPALEAYLAQAYLAAGQPARASEIAAAARAQHPDDFRLITIEAQARLKLGASEQAFSLLEQAVASRRDDPQAQLALAGLYLDGRNYKRAEEVLVAAAAKFPGEVLVPFQLGAVFEEQKRYEAAEEAFTRALALDADHAPTLNYLGYMYAERGIRLDEALRMLHTAVKQDPYNGSYLDSLGWAYYKKGDLQQAREYLVRAGEQMPGNSVVQDHVGDLLFALNDAHGAVLAWQRALAGDGRSIDRTSIQHKIQRAQSRRR